MRSALAAIWIVGLSLPAIAQTDTSFTYQGSLAQSGHPAQGAFDLAFSLWDAAIGGNQIGAPIQLDDHPIDAGLFTADLDFGAGAFDHSPRWLAVRVNGVDLLPREPVTRSPYSLQTRGIFVDADENVGMGTTQPLTKLHVAGSITADGDLNTVNPNNPEAVAFLGWTTDAFGNDVARIRIAGNGSGSTNGLDIQRPGERSILRVLDNGYVGIGTTTPSHPLHILASLPYVRYTDADGGSDWLTGVHGGGVGFNVTQVGVGTRFAIDESGHVGIGTENPTSRLEVVDAGGAHAFEVTSDNPVYPTIYAQNTRSGGSVLWAVGASDAEPSGGGVIVAGDPAGQNVAIDGNEIMARSAGSPSTLYLNADGGDVSMGRHQMHPAFAYGLVAESGAIINASTSVTGVQRTSQGDYRVYVDGGAQPGDIMITTIASRVAVAGARVEGSRYFVYLRGNSTGDPLDADFQFVVYRP